MVERDNSNAKGPTEPLLIEYDNDANGHYDEWWVIGEAGAFEPGTDENKDAWYITVRAGDEGHAQYVATACEEYSKLKARLDDVKEAILVAIVRLGNNTLESTLFAKELLEARLKELMKDDRDGD